MNPLIAPNKIYDLAFTRHDYLPPGAISELHIVEVQERYIRPVVGEELFAALATGSHPALLEEFAAPVIACGVKLSLLPQLRLHIAPGGVMEPSGEGWKPLTEESLHSVCKALRKELEGLRRRLDRELKRLHRAGELPEYNPQENIRNRCRIYGDFVETL